MTKKTHPHLIITQKGTICTVQINSPSTLNTLTTEILLELDAAFTDLAKATDIRVVILTGTDKSFVAGASIAEMSHFNSAQGKAFGELGAAVFRKIELLNKPVIAAINGFALGGGCELAISCDIRIASEKAKIGQPEVGLGITPGFSGTLRLPRIVGIGKAKELIYTGRIIDAQEAEKIGLVDQVTKASELENTALEMAELIAQKAPLAVAYAKEAINRGVETDLDSGISIENNLFALCFDTNDQKAGMQAFLSKEEVTYKGN